MLRILNAASGTISVVVFMDLTNVFAPIAKIIVIENSQEIKSESQQVKTIVERERE